MKPHTTGLVLGALAILVLSACPTTGSVPGGAGPRSEAASAANVSAEAAEPLEIPLAASLVEALYQSCGELSRNIPGPASIAVISIASDDPAEGEFAVEELTFLLVNAKQYSVVDRRNLDIIRAEQNFQLSGEVDDDTAVSIGHFIGAAIVITGNIGPYDTAKYLRLKALDVETGEIRAMVSRRFNGL